MASSAATSLLHHIQQLTTARSLADLSDRDLLRRFADERDDASFSALVSRHGPMVWNVCQRVLHNESETEDAFQATFLVLARKTASSRWHESVANWLYQVATLLARRAKASARTRQSRESNTRGSQSIDPTGEITLREAQTVLDEELAHLPERFRAPLVLCYLKNATRDEAARQLGWSLGTLKRRLESGRELLRVRLTRRGLTFSGALLPAALVPSTMRPAIPFMLRASTVQATLAYFGGNAATGVVAPEVTKLVEGTMNALPATKVKFVASLLLTVALLTAGAGLAAPWALTNDQSETKRETPPQPPGKEQAAGKPAEGKEARVDRFGDPLPDGALFRLGTIRFRHADGINSSALSPDGKLLATAAKTTIAVWDVATGKRVHFFRDCDIPDNYNDAGAKLAFSPDGKWLAQLCEFEFAARIWDLDTDESIQTFGKRPPQPKGVRGLVPLAGPGFDDAFALQFTGDGKGLVLYGTTVLHGKTEMSFFHSKTGERLRSVTVPNEIGAYSADGKRVAVLTDAAKNATHRLILLCSAETGKEESRLEVPFAESSMSVALSHDGKMLATTNGNAECRIWEPATGKELRVFKLPEAEEGAKAERAFTAFYFAPDEKTLYAGTRKHGIHRYDLETGKELAPLLGHVHWVTGLHLDTSGKTLVSASWDNTIRRWELPSGKEIPLPEGYARSTSAARSPDGDEIAVADLSGRLDLWSAANGKLVRNLQTSGSAIAQIAFSPDGKKLAAGSEKGVVDLWDPHTGKQIGSLSGADQKKEPEWMDVLFSPEGSRLLTGSRKSGLRLWEVATGKAIWSVATNGDYKAAFSPDGKSLVTGGWNSRLSFRDPATGEEKRGVTVEADPEQRGQGTFIDSIAFSPDGKLLATTHHDGLIRFWDPASATEVKRLRGHEGAIWTVRFSPNGKWAVSGSLDNTARIWDVVAGKEVLKLVGQDAWVREAEFSPDCKTILTGGSTEVLLWNARPPQPPFRDLAVLWEDLLSADAPKAYQTVWSLSALGKEAPAFLEKRLAPVKAEDPKRLAKLIADLDNDEFATREAAAKALSELGRQALPAVRDALKNPSSAESERRLKLLRDEFDKTASLDEIRQSRAVQSLELAATPEARKLLETWAKGKPGAMLTQEAKATLERLAKRTATPP